MDHSETWETVCRVCGYDDADVFWADGWPTAEICSCCGNESDVADDSVMALRDYRGHWVGQGAPWHSPGAERRHKSRGWDLLGQLANIPERWR
ncbi:hypothetical protein [Streptomyces justiciae]|uniref:GATA-type domain-containing protein n=1 Tax=Streptomyces justiciae TaxID=2780140 RepID=A0ABU3LL29_9ACTN|nr:hypothetical protein [Streptomyces justiciae]MDT7839956.1 hypothetical protein [Streptomyces justiciae]